MCVQSYRMLKQARLHLSESFMLSACRNEPNVHKEALEANPDGWRGSELSVTIQGNWSNYRWLWHAISVTMLALCCGAWPTMTIGMLCRCPAATLHAS